jgi:hypothetical protein
MYRRRDVQKERQTDKRMDGQMERRRWINRCGDYSILNKGPNLARYIDDHKICTYTKVLFVTVKNEGKRSSSKFPPKNVVGPLPAHWVEKYVMGKKNLI